MVLINIISFAFCNMVSAQGLSFYSRLCLISPLFGFCVGLPLWTSGVLALVIMTITFLQPNHLSSPQSSSAAEIFMNWDLGSGLFANVREVEDRVGRVFQGNK